MRGQATINLCGSDLWYTGFVEGLEGSHILVSNATQHWMNETEFLGIVYLPAQMCVVWPQHKKEGECLTTS